MATNLFRGSCTPNLGGVQDYYTKAEINQLFRQRGGPESLFLETGHVWVGNLSNVQRQYQLDPNYYTVDHSAGTVVNLSADRLRTARTLSLTGVVTGTASSNLATGFTINTTVAPGTITGAMIGTGTITDTNISSTAEIAVSKLADGTPRQLLETAADGTTVQWATNIDVPGTLDVTGNALFDANVVISGNLTVSGTQTILDVETLQVEDRNIELGKVATPTDITADGGGITLLGDTGKTILWERATASWSLSEHLNIASGRSYRINNIPVLSATALGASVQISTDNIPAGTVTNGDLAGGIVDTKLDTIVSANKVAISALDIDGGIDIGAPLADTDLFVVDDGGAGTNRKVVATRITDYTFGKVSGDITVSSGGTAAITAGVIVDADISATAEIAVSKLADGAPRQLLETAADGVTVQWTDNIDVPGTLDVTGNAIFDSTLGVGGNTAGVVAGVTVTSKFCVKQEGTSPVGGFVHAENSSATTGSGIFACRSRGTLASPIIVQNNDRLASLFIAGHDGVDLALAAEIDFEVDGSPGSNNMPGRIIFRTTPAGDQSPVERLRIDSTGLSSFVGSVTLSSGNDYRINGAKVLDATSLGSAVVSSSLTSVGTISTGVWQGTAITDTYLATISTAGKVSNSATTATSANTVSAIVARDGSGNFTAGTITATLTGNASTATKLSSARTFALSGNVTGTISSDLDTGFTISTSIASGVVTSDMIANGAIVDGDISATAAIAFSKLAPLPSANILVGSSSNVATSVAVTGDVTISNTGVTAIAAGAIINNDISATAEISVSKLANGTARQLLQTATNGTDVEWASNIDVPGTLDVTGVATFDSSVIVGGFDITESARDIEESRLIRRNATLSIGTPGTVPFGVGPIIPPGMSLVGIGPDSYNVIDIYSGSVC